MSNKNEIINILKAELTLLSKEVLRDVHNSDLKKLHKSAGKLYEKISVIQYLTKLGETDELLEMLSRNDKTNNDIIKIEGEENENIVIDNIAQENKKEEEKEYEINKSQTQVTENPYKSVSEMKFVPKDKEQEQPEPTFSLKKMNIGLNDKISFIKHLFNGDAEMYEKVISNLNVAESYEKGLSYIYTEIKPNYNNWEGKEEYEFRLIQLFELKFN